MSGQRQQTRPHGVPCIVTVGEPGRAVVFGWAAALPEPEQACELRDARLVLWWGGSRGLFWLAQHGPGAGSRITCAVDVTRVTARQVLSVSTEAARALTEWPDA